MSDRIFRLTDFPGLAPKLTRAPYYRTTIQEAISGKEMRTSWWGSPRCKWDLTMASLRHTDQLNELRDLVGFFHAHAGQLDSFLLEDPTDSAIVDHGFGLGDGSTIAYQLQTTSAIGYADELGRWAAPQRPWRNEIIDSQLTDVYVIQYDEEDPEGPWVTPPPGHAWYAQGNTAECVISQCAPPNWHTYLSATRITAGAVGDNIALYMGEGYFSPPTLDAADRTVSVWLRANAPCAGSIAFGLGGSEVRVTVNLTTSWQRVELPKAGHTVWYVVISATPMQGQTLALDVWGPQVNIGLEAARYLPSPDDAPSEYAGVLFWPELGDGYVPAWEPRPSAIYADGVELTRTDEPTDETEYTIGAPGVVTFGAPPADGAILTWSGTLLHRVRFADDDLPLSQIVPGLWQGGVKLIEVKP